MSSATEGAKLYVGNLPYSTTSEELTEIAAAIAPNATGMVMMDKMTGRSRGFGFIIAPDPAGAALLIGAFNGKDFGGRAIVVNEARPMEARSPRSDRGNFGGGYGPAIPKTSPSPPAPAPDESAPKSAATMVPADSEPDKIPRTPPSRSPFAQPMEKLADLPHSQELRLEAARIHADVARSVSHAQATALTRTSFCELLAESVGRRGFAIEITRGAGSDSVDVVGIVHATSGLNLLLHCERVAATMTFSIEPVKELLAAQAASSSVFPVTGFIGPNGREYVYIHRWDFDEGDYVDVVNWATHAVRRSMPKEKQFDVFISHASEDKVDIARPLYNALIERGVSVWFDEAVLKLGDSLRQRIDDGLAKCKYGIVILSPQFFRKNWPKRELDGLVARETVSGIKAILPVWHNVGVTEVLAWSPPLADRVAANSADGIAAIVEKIVDVLGN